VHINLHVEILMIIVVCTRLKGARLFPRPELSNDAVRIHISTTKIKFSISMHRHIVIRICTMMNHAETYVNELKYEWFIVLYGTSKLILC